MKVKIAPFNYIGSIVEQGPVFYTVRLTSGALVIAPTSLIETVECSPRGEHGFSINYRDGKEATEKEVPSQP